MSAKDEYLSNIIIIYVMQIMEKMTKKESVELKRGALKKCNIFSNIYFLMKNKTLRNGIYMKYYMLQKYFEI